MTGITLRIRALDSTSAVNRQWPRVVQGVVADVKSGRLRIGHTWPGMTDLGRSYGVGVDVARRAAKILRDAGVVDITSPTITVIAAVDIQIKEVTPAYAAARPRGGYAAAQVLRHVRTAGDMSWMRDGSCTDMYPTFDGETPGDVTAAKDTCRACPVAIQCFRYAMTAEVSAGVWGGTTPEERTSIRKSAAVRAKRAAA